GTLRFHLRDRVIDAWIAGGGEADHVPHARAFAPYPLDLLRLLGGRDEDRRGTRVSQDVGDLLGREIRIEWHVGVAAGQTGIVGDGPLRAILGEDPDAIAASDA